MNKCRTVAIIQARTSSKRLAKKVLIKLGEKTVLEHVIERAMKACEIELVVVATSNHPEDDEIEKICRLAGAGCFRGSIDNVLERYVQAAQKFNADIVVRLTADNPLTEPGWIDMAVAKLKAEILDYVNAKLPDEFPVGMGNEVITTKALQKSLANAKVREDFEHVTWYCLSHRNEFKLAFLTNPDKASGVNFRVTLDEPDDLKLLKTLWKRFPNQLSHSGLVAVLKKEPGVFTINKNVKEHPNLYTRN